MKNMALAISATALLFGSIAMSAAQDRDKGSGAVPGQEMKERGSIADQPGASGFAPRHQDRDDRGTLREQDESGVSQDKD
jgi:hypothetical protein